METEWYYMALGEKDFDYPLDGWNKLKGSNLDVHMGENYEISW